MDGVSVEARKWEWALRELGFATRRIAGELEDGLRPDDVWLAFLAIDPAPGARIEADALAAAVAGADLVVVENLCSLPLNLVAAETTARVLSSHADRVLFHHHDLPWERPHLAHLDAFPPHQTGALHVTVSRHAERGLRARGIEATTIYNTFDLEGFAGDRGATRSEMSFGDEDVVVLQPTRAIVRKNVPMAIRYTEELARRLPGRSVRFWLTGRAEERYGPELDAVLAASRVPVTTCPATRAADAYAASDLVVFPSSWEGFGNPVVESIASRRPLAVASYPALEELVALGLQFLPIDDPALAVHWLEHAAVRGAPLDANLAVARRHFSIHDLPRRIREAMQGIGWAAW